MSQKLLTISLLVSGRYDTTIKCLDSLKPLLSQIDSELILVDTGCDDALREKMLAYTEKIIPFTWCDDFAKARNAGLSQASGEWFLFLDDDEWFEDVTPIIDFFRSGEYKEYGQAVYLARNYVDKSGQTYVEEWVSRMIQRGEETHFEGKVHEALLPVVGKCKKIHAFVHHYGYAYDTEEEKIAHFKRNEQILSKLIEEEPNNMRWRLEILLEYNSIGMGKQLYEVAKSALTLIEKNDASFVNQCRGAFYSAMLKALIILENVQELEEKALEFRSDKRNTPATNASICAITANGMQQFGKLNLAQEYCERYFHYYKEEEEARKARSEQEQIIEESILFVKDEITQKRNEQMVFLWADVLLELGEISRLPSQKISRIEALVQKMLDGNGEFLYLPDVVWKLGESGMLPLEEMLLALPLSQWIVMNSVLTKRTEIAEHISKIRTVDDIRYRYLDMHNANYFITQEQEDKTYEQKKEILTFFAESNLAYAKSVYTEDAFLGKMEVLPESVKAAVYVERALAFDTKDWSKHLELLGDAVKIYPQMGEFIKQYATALGEEQKRQEEQAKEAQLQLQQMAVQVKQQIRTLLDAGMKEEAYQIVCQLQSMLPLDSEIAELEKELRP